MENEPEDRESERQRKMRKTAIPKRYVDLQGRESERRNGMATTKIMVHNTISESIKETTTAETTFTLIHTYTEDERKIHGDHSRTV